MYEVPSALRDQIPSGVHPSRTNSQSDDEARLDDLVQRYEPALAKVVSRCNAPPNLRDDCLQAARIGFLRAYRNFDSDRGVALWSYAKHFVKGEVIRVLESEVKHVAWQSEDDDVEACHDPTSALPMWLQVEIGRFLASLPGRLQALAFSPDHSPGLTRKKGDPV